MLTDPRYRTHRLVAVYIASWLLCVLLYWLTGEPWRRGAIVTAWFVFSFIATAVAVKAYDYLFE